MSALSFWWKEAYPAAHKTLQYYAMFCENSGLDWRKALQDSLRFSPEKVPSEIVNLSRQLGSRIFEQFPVFSVGDGVSIVTAFGTLPATVIYVDKRTVRVQEDRPVVQRGGARVLYVPQGKDACHTFTRRDSGLWKIQGSRSRIFLKLGRKFKSSMY